jgi:1-acyl-sn-glycerol-3-phosphate acyltransferase
MPADEVLLVPPRTVLKTPSGKIRRGACRELYERGDLARGRPSAAMQLVRLAASGVGPVLGRFFRGLGSSLFAFYAWTVFVGIGLVAWPAAVLLPGAALRRAVVRAACRAVLALTRVRVSATGLAAIPGGGPCVIAANHASYLDVLVLYAVLPSRFAFVAKRELLEGFVTRLLLKRLGTLFVERFDPEKSGQDADSVAEAVRQGRAIVVFPEGTFGRAPGLRPFRLGAFVVSAQTGAPLVPLAMRGTRSILRDTSWRPRRGAVGVTIFEPLKPGGVDWAAAVRLRDEARERILRACGEPDLIGE